MKDNFAILQNHLKLQADVTFDGVIDLGFAKIAYSNTETSPFENFALTDKVLSEDERNQIEQTFQKWNKKSAISFETTQELEPLSNILKTNNYHKHHEESWMFHQGEDIDTGSFDSVKKVTNEDELALFLETFDSSFQKDDPINPFGELGEYLTITEKAWYKHHETNRIEFFIAFKDGKPVATSTLNNFDGVGYISNVGSRREVRGQGFGKKVTLYAVYMSVQNGNANHYLITEEGTYPNEFYKRLGFVTKFTVVCYFKS